MGLSTRLALLAALPLAAPGAWGCTSLADLSGGTLDASADAEASAGSDAAEGGAGSDAGDATVDAPSGDAPGSDALADAGSDACQADTSSDPHNCGRCGHDCLGGACTKGQCQPVVFSTGDVNILDLALNDTNLYWPSPGAGAMTGTIQYCPLGGCASHNPIVLASGQPLTQQLAVDTLNAYWTNFGGAQGTGTVAECPLTGCANPTVAAMGLSTPNPIASNGKVVVWGDITNPGTLMTCNAPACAGSVKILNVTAAPPVSIALDDTTVFWTGGLGNGTGALLSCAIANCGIAIALAVGAPQYLTLDATNVYWTDSGSIFAARKDGTGATKLATNVGNPSGIAVDAATVFWTDAVAGSVSSALSSGGPVEVLATGQGSPSEVVANATALYWVDGGSTIMMLAR